MRRTQDADPSSYLLRMTPLQQVSIPIEAECHPEPAKDRQLMRRTQDADPSSYLLRMTSLQQVSIPIEAECHPEPAKDRQLMRRTQDTDPSSYLLRMTSVLAIGFETSKIHYSASHDGLKLVMPLRLIVGVLTVDDA